MTLLFWVMLCRTRGRLLVDGDKVSAAFFGVVLSG